MEKGWKECKQQDQARGTKEVNNLEKNTNIACLHNYSLKQVSFSTRSCLSGNNTPDIVHLTKRSNIIESEVAIEACLTTSEQNTERQEFEADVRLSNSPSGGNPVHPRWDFLTGLLLTPCIAPAALSLKH